MKKLIVIFAVLVLIALPMTVFAAGDVIRIVPVGEPHTGMAIITESPASLQINLTSGAQSPAYDVWLLFVIDETTYNGLNSITLSGTDGPTTLAKSDFTGVPSDNKIPETDDTNWVGNGHNYPGCTNNTRYAVGAVLSQISQVHPTTSIRYVLVYGFDSIDTSPTYFTITVDSTTHINVLILAQGRINGEAGDPLNSNSPFSGSTLVVPELATILIALASFSALALYTAKRRKT